MAVKKGSSWPRSSSSEAAASRRAPSRSPVIGKLHAMASWHTARRKGSWIPARAVPGAGRPPALRCRHRCRRPSLPPSRPARPGPAGPAGRRAGTARPMIGPGPPGLVATRTATAPGTGAAAARAHGQGTSAPRRPGCPPRRPAVQPIAPAGVAQRPVRLLGQRPVVAGVPPADIAGSGRPASRSAMNPRTVSSIRDRGPGPVLST